GSPSLWLSCKNTTHCDPGGSRPGPRERVRPPDHRMCARRMKHIGIVACSAEGAALCYRTICRKALAVVGNNDHPRITLDSIPLARWMPAFDAGDSAGV